MWDLPGPSTISIVTIGPRPRSSASDACAPMSGTDPRTTRIGAETDPLECESGRSSVPARNVAGASRAFG